jgi:hypothetical protein
MTIWWEPQNDVTSDPGGNCYLNPGATGGSTTEYIAMWRNVESRSVPPVSPTSSG